MAGSVEISFDGIAVEYSEYLASLGMKKSTTAFYIKDAEGFFSWVRENTGADKLETGREEIEAYTAYLRDSGISPATEARCISSLRRFFKWACMRGYVYFDPTLGLKQPKLIKKQPEILTQSEILSILGAVDKKNPKGLRDRAMIELMFTTGISVSELLELEVDGVDTRKRQINVGEGRGRVLKVTGSALRSLKKYERIRSGTVEGGSEDVFFLSCQGRKMTRQGFWKLFKSYAVTAGIEKDVSPEALRHSFAVNAFLSGESAEEVRKKLGHITKSPTLEYESIASGK